MERGEPRGSQQRSDVGLSRGQHGSYGQFFNRWGERAREHHTQREGYRSRQQSSRNSTRARNPQPGEAKRWLRQAEADITATENDIFYQRPSYEWACFKCHQVSWELYGFLCSLCSLWSFLPPFSQSMFLSRQQFFPVSLSTWMTRQVLEADPWEY